MMEQYTTSREQPQQCRRSRSLQALADSKHALSSLFSITRLQHSGSKPTYHSTHNSESNPSLHKRPTRWKSIKRVGKSPASINSSISDEALLPRNYQLNIANPDPSINTDNSSEHEPDDLSGVTTTEPNECRNHHPIESGQTAKLENEYDTASEISSDADEGEPQDGWNSRKAQPLDNVMHSSMMDPEVADTLLEWKRRSLLDIDWSNLFSLQSELWRVSQLFSGFQDVITVSKKEIDLVNRYGQTNQLNSTSLQKFLDTLCFERLEIDIAFRTLWTALQLDRMVADIDRLIEAFARRYWTCNISGIYGSAATVYITIYTLMLLNTDLYIHQTQKEMSETTFCDQIIETVEENRSVSNINNEPRHKWQQEMRKCLKKVYWSLHRTSLTTLVSNDMVATARRKGQGKPRSKPVVVQSTVLDSEKMGTTIRKRAMSLTTGTWTRLRRKDKQMHLKGPYKEGPLACKLNPKDSEWKICWVILESGFLYIYMYSADASLSDDPRSQRISLFGNEQRGHMMSPSTSPFLEAQISLGHTVAERTTEPGRTKEKECTFSLTLANGRMHLLNCSSNRESEAWIDACNHWAARESKVPSQNINATLCKWKPSSYLPGSSLLNQHQQYKAIQGYLAYLYKQQKLSDGDTQEIDREIQRYICYEKALEREV
ncbi:uncharacterized protein BYT42DRAFT_562278 [Radiomyces spectabilis]|uniref:uncharacterized protein n=1 Tax=Radiomyces spectabilis TaxID=64574 RepID=UPI00221F63DB|nr:uncharacterized protein BYT42DRAFT_562278 [Radiomyces spectabilis]KAI8384372.1 hypothetical protein BYT42DRAFT_562278 [Radiomyces spectabilis]